MFKNEAPYLKEWLEHYLNRNIDHFIGQGYDENDKPLYSGDSSGEKIR